MRVDLRRLVVSMQMVPWLAPVRPSGPGDLDDSSVVVEIPGSLGVLHGTPLERSQLGDVALDAEDWAVSHRVCR